MLVLSRKKGERVVIGDGVSRVDIVILSIGDGKVRIGIEAPRDIPVHRMEVYENIYNGKKEDEINGKG